MSGFLLFLRWLDTGTTTLQRSFFPVSWDLAEAFALYSAILSTASRICSRPWQVWTGTSSALWTPWWTSTQTQFLMRVLFPTYSAWITTCEIFTFWLWVSKHTCKLRMNRLWKCVLAPGCRRQRERRRGHHKAFWQRPDDLQRDSPQLSRLPQVPRRVSEMSRHPAYW